MKLQEPTGVGLFTFAMPDHTTESMTSDYIRHEVGKKVRLPK